MSETARDEHECRCERCWSETPPPAGEWGLIARPFIVCGICGNKRCPHATDHRHACTNSNEAGQPGSSYTLPNPPHLDRGTADT